MLAAITARLGRDTDVNTFQMEARLCTSLLEDVVNKVQFRKAQKNSSRFSASNEPMPSTM
jgi:hypothetical protein